MAVYCTNCGATIDEGVNFCPQCGASLTGSVGSGKKEWSDTAKTAAAVGGAVLGASALSSLVRRMTHRRRPPYGGPPMGGFGPGPGFGHGPGHGPGPGMR